MKTRKNFAAAIILTAASAQPAMSADSFRPPVLPFEGGSGSTSPWGGLDVSRRRIEPQLANSVSEAMNEAWARIPAPKDVIVAVPIKMIPNGPNENGDGQINSMISWEGWKNPDSTRSLRPPLVAALIRGDDVEDIVFRLDPGFVAPGNAVVVRYPSSLGGFKQLTLVAPLAGGAIDWRLPSDIQIESLLERKLLFLSADQGTSWLPLWFRIPIRAIGDLTAPLSSSAPANDLMSTVPSDFLHYSDSSHHYVLDHEDVGQANQTSAVPGETPFSRLSKKQDSNGFKIPYIHFNKPGLHDELPDAQDPAKLDTVAVGQFWNWTPFGGPSQPLFQPLSDHYLCLDKRDPQKEDPGNPINGNLKAGGVITGANWHKVHLEFAEMQGMGPALTQVPLGAAESFFNNLEGDRSLFVGFATAHAMADPIPGKYAFARTSGSGTVPDSGLTDVATFRFVRPGEVFITPNSGTVVNSRGTVVDQSTYHTALSYQSDSPACVEVWTPPCTPGDNLDFACATTRVTFQTQSSALPTGTSLFFKGSSTYVINVQGKPFRHSDQLSPGTAAANGIPTQMNLVSSANGIQTWQLILELPQSTLMRYELFKQLPATGVQASASGSFSVPVATDLKVTFPGVVK